jgi:hypothetical protein
MNPGKWLGKPSGTNGLVGHFFEAAFLRTEKMVKGISWDLQLYFPDTNVVGMARAEFTNASPRFLEKAKKKGKK